jgi:hypothetical protein
LGGGELAAALSTMSDQPETNMKLKGDPTLNAVVLVTAGVTGMITGMSVEGLSALGKLGASIAVGIAVGGALYFALSAVRRRRSREPPPKA